jgi:tetratricopeptide (TPR) repeat protein
MGRERGFTLTAVSEGLMVEGPKSNDAKVGLVIVGAILVFALFGGGFVWLVARVTVAGIEYGDHQTKADRYDNAGDSKNLIREADAMIRIDPKKEEGYYFRANGRYMADQYEEALPDYATAIMLEPQANTRADLYYCRGNCYYQMEKYDDAIREYGKALKLNPKMSEPHEYRAWCQYKLENYEAALDDASAAIARTPRSADLYYLRGVINRDREHEGDAIKDFKQALTLNPNGHDAIGRLAGIYEGKQQYDKAAALYQEAVHVDPENANFWGQLGWEEYLAGEVDDAARDSRHALDLDPKLYFAIYNSGLCYAVKGDWLRARGFYERALKRRDQDTMEAALDDLFNVEKTPTNAAAVEHARELILSAMGKEAAKQYLSRND